MYCYEPLQQTQCLKEQRRSQTITCSPVMCSGYHSTIRSPSEYISNVLRSCTKPRRRPASSEDPTPVSKSTPHFHQQHLPPSADATPIKEDSSVARFKNPRKHTATTLSASLERHKDLSCFYECPNFSLLSHPISPALFIPPHRILKKKLKKRGAKIHCDSALVARVCAEGNRLKGKT